jgi:hypothetical protein
MQYRSAIPKVCERARTYASLRLESELSDFERALLDAHVAACASCADFVSDIGALTGELRRADLQRLENPLQLPVRVRAGFRRLQVGAAAAVLISVVGVGSLIGSVSRPEAPRFATLNTEPATPTLRELRAQDLRAQETHPVRQPPVRRGTKLIPI